ncbi:MAG: asparaginyl/glutamyl-tRNA amidotransferase subunit C [Candidatus Nealsonbacteria bacterium RBG_13_42_11]|uniref:Aspartyl/glutamyl-tRNA(Asn/Gln) amidotransferase subunit C n=1 Tax=Candidatus Nealsonbacteria bacterium RBG_13_42_11 TaxID=1801663 RepID=A0A1G2E0X0_9BACT|nr:MAG: asparaginyl/glutamyl-tRNA amidotransferase subunit C [Candidatus Nealsonbacteria bacterium RBG_13_42_11]
MISNDEVKHVAKLARLSLTEKETEKFQKELSSILDYVAELKELDVSDIPATSHPFEAENVTRKDWERISDSKSQATKKIIDLAPETKESYFKVKSILK